MENLYRNDEIIHRLLSLRGIVRYVLIDCREEGKTLPGSINHLELNSLSGLAITPEKVYPIWLDWTGGAQGYYTIESERWASIDPDEEEEALDVQQQMREDSNVGIHNIQWTGREPGKATRREHKIVGARLYQHEFTDYALVDVQSGGHDLIGSLYPGEVQDITAIGGVKMPVVKKTFYGRVRRTAYNLWRGPDYVENVEKEDEDNPLGGGCVLRLAIRKGETAKPMIESRAVYASLHPDYTQDAILRAIYWDNKALAHISNLPYETPFKIPAKFVHIPLTLLQQWINSLDNVQTSIKTSSLDDDSLPICTLKVETNAVSSLFEKTWQVVQNEDSELNRIWQDIWEQMGQALQTAPIVTNLEESFPHVEPEANIYDLQAYQPSLTLP